MDACSARFTEFSDSCFELWHTVAVPFDKVTEAEAAVFFWDDRFEYISTFFPVKSFVFLWAVDIIWKPVPS